MRADRLLSILMMLQIRGHATAHELAERLEVSERTIYRDIEALSAAGVPVYAERGPGGGCMLAEGYRTNLTGLTETEVRTLFTPGVAAPLSDLGAGKALEAALLKLLAALPVAHRQNIERTRQRLYMDAAAWYRSNEEAPFLQMLQEAIWHDRCILLTYRKSNGEMIERRIEPLGLVAKAGIWYMVALSFGEYRVFRVSRVRGVIITDEPCQRPKDFDLEKFWAAWSVDFQATWPQYPVTLRVSPLFVPILSQVMGENIHKAIEEAPLPDAEGWITITYTFETFEVARSNCIRFGTMVEVLEPEELRQGVRQFAASIVAFYDERDS